MFRASLERTEAEAWGGNFGTDSHGGEEVPVLCVIRSWINSVVYCPPDSSFYFRRAPCNCFVDFGNAMAHGYNP